MAAPLPFPFGPSSGPNPGPRPVVACGSIPGAAGKRMGCAFHRYALHAPPSRRGLGPECEKTPCGVT
ncbi:hypothetical protein [Deinococcus humi]|uniref:Uncharacterized protein n=1 Tax=Deinococcus humi TaxID=662880 RepID=A0A7W8K1U1_9DEIO|nr:hypothetical protein [Deinococcus humi]MBB5365951.1 hypothetical protein [Deinococcus humi]